VTINNNAVVLTKHGGEVYKRNGHPSQLGAITPTDENKRLLLGQTKFYSQSHTNIHASSYLYTKPASS